MVDQSISCKHSGRVGKISVGTTACVVLINRVLLTASGPSVFVAFKSPLSALIIQELKRLWPNEIMFRYPRNDAEPFLIEIKLMKINYAGLGLIPGLDGVSGWSSKGKVINCLA